MALPPHSFGPRGHSVEVARRADGRWIALVDGRLLESAAFGSADAARAAGAEEVLRLEATAQALLGRVRRGLGRKMR